MVQIFGKILVWMMDEDAMMTLQVPRWLYRRGVDTTSYEYHT